MLMIELLLRIVILIIFWVIIGYIGEKIHNKIICNKLKCIHAYLEAMNMECVKIRNKNKPISHI